jgi:DNA-binding transcriptional regulator YiaG
MKCYACGGEKFETRPVEIVTRVGEHHVVNRTFRRPVCLACQEYVVPATMLERVELQAALIAFTDAPTVTGAMLRYGRKALGLTQTELAERISSTKESISRWEREERHMEPWVPLTVLSLLRERLMPPPKDVEFKRAG